MSASLVNSLIAMRPLAARGPLSRGRRTAPVSLVIVNDHRDVEFVLAEQGDEGRQLARAAERSPAGRRIPCPTDKRSNLAQLAAKGRQKLSETAPGRVAAARHLVTDALNGEQQRALA